MCSLGRIFELERAIYTPTVVTGTSVVGMGGGGGAGPILNHGPSRTPMLSEKTPEMRSK